MSAGPAPLSLYWLDDCEAYLGEQRCLRPSTAWFGLGADTPVTVGLATRHIFLYDGGADVTVIPLRFVEEATLTESGDHLRLSFLCKRALRRAVLPATHTQPAIAGVCVPHANAETWVCNVPRSTDAFVEALRRLVARQRVDDLLSRREIALQSTPSCVSFRVRRQVPMREQRGVLLLSDTRIVFEPLFALAGHGRLELRQADCHHSFSRWIVFEAVGLDVYASAELDRPPALSLIFNNTRERDEAAALLQQLLRVPAYAVSIHATVEDWKAGHLSNYEYLLLLNKWSSRCLNDVFQYPVFPWVIADYSSAQLDLSSPATFRDLHKPVGALSADRLAMLRERAQFLDEAEERSYLYSTHYSSAGVVAYYLVRPHPEFQLCLQGGVLDVAERIMESLPQVWRSVTTNTSNFRELIPEFFSGEFGALCGPPRLPLGVHGSGRAVAPLVELPPWAGDAETFVRLHRAALESDHVSAHLHGWIDLVFGVAQSGVLARAADNVFHPFSYRQLRTCVSVPGLHLSPHEYAREFGNVPMQLFCDAHPSRTDEDDRAVLCTAEAMEACGSVANAVVHQRLLQMMGELQTLAEETDDVPPCTDVAAVAAAHLASAALTLSVLSTAPLPCTSVRFATLGVAGADSASLPPGTAVLLVVGEDGRVVTLLNAATGARLRSFPDFDSRTSCTAFAAGRMVVFTEARSGYIISLASLAVTHCVSDVTPFATVCAAFGCQCALLADSGAQLSWWSASAQGESTAESLLCAAPLFTCEATSRIACVGSSGSARSCVAVSERRDVFRFHDDTFEEFTLHAVPADAAVLAATPAGAASAVWVFFRSEAGLYDDAGCCVRRVAFAPASTVVCAYLGDQLYPLCFAEGRSSLPVRVLTDDEASARETMLACPLEPRVLYAGDTLALVGRSDVEGGGCAYAVTLVALAEEATT